MGRLLHDAHAGRRQRQRKGAAVQSSRSKDEGRTRDAAGKATQLQDVRPPGQRGMGQAQRSEAREGGRTFLQ
eukprot:12262645-Alexandrium_andersonii.AAC.1